MKPDRKPQFTIGRFMVWTGVIAALLAGPRIILSPDAPVAFYLVGIVASLALLNALIEVVLGKPCPACSRRALRRLARHRHYYRCMACRAQLKRFGFGPWLDASGPEDAGRYHKPSDYGTWKAFDIPRNLEGSSSGLLLGHKRSRDLIEEVRQSPPKPDSGRRLEEAEKRVRRFLERRHDLEEG